jgi:hypothetical protein
MKETLSAPTSLFSSILTSMGQQAEQSLQTVCFVIILLLTLDHLSNRLNEKATNQLKVISVRSQLPPDMPFVKDLPRWKQKSLFRIKDLCNVFYAIS